MARRGSSHRGGRERNPVDYRVTTLPYRKCSHFVQLLANTCKCYPGGYNSVEMPIFPGFLQWSGTHKRLMMWQLS